MIYIANLIIQQMTDGGEKNWLMKSVKRFCPEKVFYVIGITRYSSLPCF
jgi:hypothetical protein